MASAHIIAVFFFAAIFLGVQGPARIPAFAYNRQIPGRMHSSSQYSANLSWYGADHPMLQNACSRCRLFEQGVERLAAELWVMPRARDRADINDPLDLVRAK